MMGRGKAGKEKGDGEERRGGRWKRGEKDTRTHHCCSYKKVTRKTKQLDQETHTTKERDVALG
jgi:hypothetical protein